MGTEEEDDEEVTRTLDRGGLVEPHPADGDGPTRMLDGQPVLPRAAMRSEPDLPSTTEEGEEAQTEPLPSIQSDPPPAEKTRALPRSGTGLIGDDEVPVTEGTALLPGAQFLRAVIAAEADVDVDVHVTAPLPPMPSADAAPVIAAPPPSRGGWGRAVVLFIVTFVLTGGALLLAWYEYVR